MKSEVINVLNREGKIAVISVDNIKTFLAKALQQLYVPGGKKVAKKTVEAIKVCKTLFDALAVNVYESHPKGHISFASSYKDRKPYSTISLAEVEAWTDDDNGLSDKAKFTVPQLKEYLETCPNQQDTLRPDHAIADNESSELMLPLKSNMFDEHIAKGDTVDKHPYGGFGSKERGDDTGLYSKLESKGIKTVILTGVATEYCLYQTALEALLRGFEVIILTDAIAAIDEGKGQEILQALKSKGVKLHTLDQLKGALVSNT